MSPTLSFRYTSGTGAGWSSPVARQAHNLKVTGSNPVPATKIRTRHHQSPPSQPLSGLSSVELPSSTIRASRPAPSACASTKILSDSDRKPCDPCVRRIRDGACFSMVHHPFAGLVRAARSRSDRAPYRTGTLARLRSSRREASRQRATAP